ncbi:MAG: hypothetical protein IJF57_01305 [Clostridia bacterium]|nr:hypothetical protein [Clostridia bacterium]
MQAVFTKVISFILSILMPVTGLFAGGTPVASSDIAVLDGGVSQDKQIITTYEEFKACFAKSTDENAFLNSINESYFENGNLAVICVTLADTAEEVIVTSAAEKGDTLKISYAVEDSGAIGATIICYSTICVKTSKSVTQIEATEKGITLLYRSFMSKLIELVR